MTPANARRLLIRNTTRQTILADTAEIADTSATRLRGLLGRDALGTGQGLWIVPCESVHSFGMRFSIDVVYLDRRKRVRKIRSNMAPWRVSMCLSAHSVLELPVGTIAHSGTQRGDQLDLVSAD